MIKSTISILLLMVGVNTVFANQEVNLYSARKETLIKPLLDAFSEKTGIKVNLITSKADALLKRIETEGINSPADVLLTTDAGRLHRAKQAGIFGVVNSTTLESNIPDQYQDSDNRWFGLSVRLRPILVTGTFDSSRLKNYEDLAKPTYKKKICIRSSNNIYNQSLVASMIASSSEQITQDWAEALVANMARKPQGGDRDQIKAAAAGQCGIAVVNTYYLAQMLANQDQTSVEYQSASKMRIIWPNQDGRGVHANISGAGVLTSAPNRKNGIKLIEFLSSDQAQQIYANVNYEYPVKDNIAVNDILALWGKFKVDTLNLTTLGENNTSAVMLMDRAGWK